MFHSNCVCVSERERERPRREDIYTGDKRRPLALVVGHPSDVQYLSIKSLLYLSSIEL